MLEHVSPLRGFEICHFTFPPLKPWATLCRPSGTGRNARCGARSVLALESIFLFAAEIEHRIGRISWQYINRKMDDTTEMGSALPGGF